MTPVVLRSRRLILNQPNSADAPDVYTYCQDPAFEHTMPLPWPYHRSDADSFIDDYVPRGWATDTEFTWALRLAEDGPLLGVVGFRALRSDLGFWLGAPHRGRGYMPEAVGAVADWVFARGVDRIAWECVVGNLASLSVARATGFTFTGEAPAEVVARDGSRPLSWHGVLTATDSRARKGGWPA